MLKKRVSFFGIFCAGENIEMIYSQYDFMKNQFNKIITELAKFENLLVDASNQNKVAGQTPNPKFELVRKQNKIENNVMMALQQ